jgi:hypothetical protein
LQTDNFRLHDKQTVNVLRKIAWASVLRLKWQHTNTNTHTHKITAISVCLLQTEQRNGTSIGLLQTETEVCFPWSANNKRKLTIGVSRNAHLTNYITK